MHRPRERHGFAGDPSAEIALADLQQSLAARRQVAHQSWGAAGETQRVDQIQIGTQAWRDDAAVREAEVARIAVREHLDGGLRRQASGAAVAAPMREHEGGGAGIAEGADMCATVREPIERARIACH